MNCRVNRMDINQNQPKSHAEEIFLIINEWYICVTLEFCNEVWKETKTSGSLFLKLSGGQRSEKLPSK